MESMVTYLNQQQAMQSNGIGYLPPFENPQMAMYRQSLGFPVQHYSVPYTMQQPGMQPGLPYPGFVPPYPMFNAPLYPEMKHQTPTEPLKKLKTEESDDSPPTSKKTSASGAARYVDGIAALPFPFKFETDSKPEPVRHT
jgi:hypothetical protein